MHCRSLAVALFAMVSLIAAGAPPDKPAAPPAAPQAAPPPADGPQATFTDSLLDNLVGEWHAAVRFPNRSAEHTVKAEWVLNHQFLQIHMKDVAKPPQYEAMVYVGFDHAADKYVLHWIDTFGGKFSETLGYAVRPEKGNNAIQFAFSYPDGEFRNSFAWHLESKTWTMLLEQKDDKGQWKLFAEETLRRIVNSQSRP
jgi:hypothetical protein